MFTRMLMLRNKVIKDLDGMNLLRLRKLSDTSNKASVDDEKENEDIVNSPRFTEEEIAIKRNKSRLANHHRNILLDLVPYFEPQATHHNTVRYKRRMYGAYGDNSGVIPNVCWPTSESISSSKEYESLSRPHTLQEMIAINNERKATEEERIRQREEEVAQKFAKLNKWKEEMETRIRNKEAEALAAKAKKDRLIEEVRRHFGFKVDPKDERFKEMLEKKEKEEKKLAKEAKKKAREAKLLSQLLERSDKSEVEKSS